MRILYLDQHFGTPEIPGRTSTYEWARRFVAAGHEVNVLTADRSGRGNGWRASDEAGVRVHWYPIRYSNHMGFNRRLLSFGHYNWVAARKGLTLPADLVIAVTTPLTVALPGVFLARRKRAPMVLEVCDLWPEIPIAIGVLRSRFTIAAARWLERFAYRNAAHVAAHSPDMKAGVVKSGYPEQQVTYVCGNCDRQRFQVPEAAGREFRRQRPWLGDRPLVIYGGAIGFINGVDYLVRVAAAVRKRNPEVRFLIVGTGREEQNVRREAQRLGVLDQTLFMEPLVPKKEMPAMLSAADIATSVFIDVREMWSNNANKLSDALGAGRPIAINHQGWLADMIRETGCGLVLDPHDVESSAEQLVVALADRQWQASARAAANRVAVERFNLDKMAAIYESILRRVREERGERRGERQQMSRGRESPGALSSPADTLVPG